MDVIVVVVSGGVSSVSAFCFLMKWVVSMLQPIALGCNGSLA